MFLNNAGYLSETSADNRDNERNDECLGRRNSILSLALSVLGLQHVPLTQQDAHGHVHR